MRVRILLVCLFSFFSLLSFGQDNIDGSNTPLRINLDEDGSRYVRFLMWHQMWLENGSEQNGPSFSIRRSRFLAYAQLSPRFLILTHFGLDGLSANGISANPNTQTNNQRSVLFLHDAWNEFAAIPGKLHIGSGLHYWNGISRLSNQSTLNMMTMDNPGAGNSDVRLFPWPNIGTSGQFARHIGIYAKGSLGKFGYRVAVNNARNNIGELSPNIPSYQVDNNMALGTWNYTGYFKIDLLDKETDKLPYMVGTYLGSQKVLSLGFGFMYHPKALATGSELSSATRDNVTHMAVDAFYDAPLNDRLAINILGAYYDFNYGGSSTFSSGGLVPGTGSVIYGQFGLLFQELQLMPYVTYNQANLRISQENSYEFALGLNYFHNGHFAKITGEYSFGKKGNINAGNTSIIRLQTHIFL